MLLQVMRHVRNFFNVSEEHGGFTLSDGKIALTDTYKVGQYIAISGSFLVGGVYKVSAINDGLYTLDGAEKDEIFTGVVYGLRVPPDFVALCGEIAEWQEKNGNSNIVSESFGTYSYSVGTDGRGGRAQWQDAFKKQLSPYRKMFTEVSI